MIPSNRWFPYGLPERAVWFMNFFVNFSAVAASLGFTAAEVAAVDNDNQVMQFLNETITRIDAYKDAVRQYRIGITELAIGKKTPEFPADLKFTLPVAVDAGIFERLNDLVDRIRVAPNFTAEIGALLGIMPTKSGSVTPESLKPVATATPAFDKYKLTVHATRMGQPAYKAQIRRANSELWEDAGFSTTADLEITVQPTTPGQSERIQVRVLLMKNNEVIGQPSDAIYVTLNP